MTIHPGYARPVTDASESREAVPLADSMLTNRNERRVRVFSARQECIGHLFKVMQDSGVDVLFYYLKRGDGEARTRAAIARGFIQ